MRRIVPFTTALLVSALAPAYAGGLVGVGTDAAGKPVVGDAGGAPPAAPVAPFDAASHPTRPAAPATPGHPAPRKVFNTTAPANPR
jgi:hypothetical protein